MGVTGNEFLDLFAFLPDEMKIAIIALITFLIGIAIVRIVL